MPAERVPLRLHLDALSVAERAMWKRFRVLIDEAGPAQMIVTKSRIAFRAERIFAGGFFAHHLDERLGGWLKMSWSVYSRPPAER